MNIIPFPMEAKLKEPLFSRNKIDYSIDQYLTKETIETYLLNNQLASLAASIRQNTYPNQIEDLISIRGYLFYITNLIKYYNHLPDYSPFLDIEKLEPIIYTYKHTIQALSNTLPINSNELTNITLYLQNQIYNHTNSPKEKINIYILSSMLEQDLLLHIKNYYTKKDLTVVETEISTYIQQYSEQVKDMMKEEYSTKWKEKAKTFLLSNQSFYIVK